MKVTICNEALDRNIVEMIKPFSETSRRLLKCIACLDSREPFSSFDHDKPIELPNIYSVDFSSQERYLLSDQLNLYTDMLKRSYKLLACDDLTCLALKLVQPSNIWYFHWFITSLDLH